MQGHGIEWKHIYLGTLMRSLAKEMSSMRRKSAFSGRDWFTIEGYAPQNFPRLRRMAHRPDSVVTAILLRFWPIKPKQFPSLFSGRRLANHSTLPPIIKFDQQWRQK